MIPLLSVSFDPWWAQRLFFRSRAAVRVIVAGRQAGKTIAAAYEVARIMCARPGTDSVLLAPNKKAAHGAKTHLRAALASALGPIGERWWWREQDAYFRLWNGARLHVRTCDSDAEEGLPARSLTIGGVLWVDEAAYVPRSAWQSARAGLLAVPDPLTIVTTSPCGKNWVYDVWLTGQPGKGKLPHVESFRFRSSQSPYCTAATVADLRREYGPKRALQELDAVFLGDGGSVFSSDEVDRLLHLGWLPIRGSQRTLGLDLAKERDFIVATLMNELGEAWILWRTRWAKWPDVTARVESLARDHQALVVLDLGGGGGHGGVLHDYLDRSLGKGRVLGVRTGTKGVKAQVIETLQSAVQNTRLKLCPGGELLELARNEFLFYEGRRRIVGGVEQWSYSGPKSEPAGDSPTGEGEDHDDCVLSLALANWGREHGWDVAPPVGDGGIASFRPGGGPSGGGAEGAWSAPLPRGSGGYFFR